MDGDDEVSSLGDNTATGELDEVNQHIDEEMEQTKIGTGSRSKGKDRKKK